MALYELDEISNCSIDALQCLEHRERRGGCVSGGVLVKFRWWLGVSQDVVAVRRVRVTQNPKRVDLSWVEKWVISKLLVAFGLDRKSADDAIQSLNGTVIGKNIVRLSWGRTPNKQVKWRGDSGQQWNGGYSRGYANHHNSNTSYNTSISFCLYLFFLQYLQVPSSPERVKDGRMLLHLLSFPNI
ncbi:hypothetical protein YC2023_005517 [Brassica napus]